MIGLIGAGGFTGQVILPALKQAGVRLKSIASAAGVTGTHLGNKFGFETSTTDAAAILANPEINTVLITTRHNSHARYVIEALANGKHVYVEKPLCLNSHELNGVIEAYERAVNPFLMVGFNRRFAPHVVKAKELLASMKEPATMIMTVNAGAVPANHWTQDREIGGGRIIGEGCHFIDTLRFLAGSAIAKVDALHVGDEGSSASEDKMTFSMKFENGAVGTVHYFANGHKAFPKERLEVFCGGRILQIDNFRELRAYGWSGFKKLKLWRQDKGHAAEMEALVSTIRDGKPSPIPFDQIVEVTRASFDIVAKAAGGFRAVQHDPDRTL